MFGFGAGNVLIGYAIDRWGYWRPALVASIVLAAGFGLAALPRRSSRSRSSTAC